MRRERRSATTSVRASEARTATTTAPALRWSEAMTGVATNMRLIESSVEADVHQRAI